MGGSGSCRLFLTLSGSAEPCSACPALSLSLREVGSSFKPGSQRWVLAWLNLPVRAGGCCSLPVTLSQTPRVQESKRSLKGERSDLLIAPNGAEQCAVETSTPTSFCLAECPETGSSRPSVLNG